MQVTCQGTKVGIVVPVRAYDSDSFTNSENQNERDKKVAIVFYMATSPQNKDLALRLLFTDCKRACKRDLGAPNRIKAIGLGTFFKTSAEFWMNPQMSYDLRIAEKALPAGQKEYRRQQERADMICKTTSATLSI